MSKHRKQTSPATVTVAIRRLSQRFSAWFFLFLALAALMVTTINDRAAMNVRTSFADILAPATAMIIHPVRDLLLNLAAIESLFHAHQENIRLQAENARLRAWYDKAMMLEARNTELAQFTNLIDEGVHSYITVRALTDTAGGFVRTILVAAGMQDGVRPDQAALVPEGLIGRVVEAGQRSARIMLLTDTTSRVPVFIEQSRTRAILAGDNTKRPALMHLPTDIEVQVGQRIVTSGHGGIFPANIPVGIVERVEGEDIRVRLFADMNHFEFLQIADYRLNTQ